MKHDFQVQDGFSVYKSAHVKETADFLIKMTRNLADETFLAKISVRFRNLNIEKDLSSF